MVMSPEMKEAFFEIYSNGLDSILQDLTKLLPSKVGNKIRFQSYDLRWIVILKTIVLMLTHCYISQKNISTSFAMVL